MRNDLIIFSPTSTRTTSNYYSSPIGNNMKVLLITALLGIAIGESVPSSSYGAPNRNGLGGSNGAPNNGYTAPNGNGGGSSNGNGNGYGASNGNGASNRNGNGNGVSRNGYAAPPSNRYGAPSNGYGVDPETAALTENIPGGGVPGEDFPILASVPETGFSCDDQAVPGYYADIAPEAGCQVFHICQERPNGRRQQDSFLCPNGTIFNQQYLVCDWWFNFDCADAESFYSVNELIGVDPNAGYDNGNGNGSNGYGTNGNGNGRRNGNGNGYSNGNGNGRNGNGSNGYSNGNGNANSNGSNGYTSNDNGNESPAAPSNDYGAPAAPSAAYGK